MRLFLFNPFLKIGIKALSTINNPVTLPAWGLNSPQLYLNVLEQRIQISADLKSKSGVYCWYNLLNGNYYIGSAIDLRSRINDYFQESYFRDKANLIIVRSILKYGLGNFALIILEYSSREESISREQYWLDLLKPEYNILEKAGSSLGYKHSLESIDKLSRLALRRNHSDEVRQAMSETRKGEGNSFYGRTHSDETRAKLREIALKRDKAPRAGNLVQVTDLRDNVVTEYPSIREAAKALNTHLSTLWRREKKGITKPYKGRYIISVIRD